MRNKTKKIIISIILGVYILSNFFQSAIYRGNSVYAASAQEEKIDYTNIVAIIVDNDIYNGIQSNLQRYAKTYIQGYNNNRYTSISNSNAMVFPIDVSNFSAKNIAQLLENLYFDGISGEPSKLVGVILVGDIPLPVVNQDGYIFPTIYPYVDFEEQKFIWDEDSKYFVYNDNPNGQAEIWHGMINFGKDIREYKAYFDKLESYLRDPSGYIGKAMWYEDFIGDSKYFNDSALNFYLNNFIFAEDLGYHRYSDLMVKVLQGQRNKEMEELIAGLSEVNSGAEYTGMDELASLTDEMNTPTMQIKKMIDNGYLASYSSLFGQKFLKTITNNVETANRWIETRTGSDGTSYYLDAFDTVYKKAELNDEIALRTNGDVEPFIIMLNNALEEAVDKKVEQEKYWLNEVIPLTYLKYEGESKWNGKCVWNIYDAYENYYFGENAQYLKSMEETSTYRGTFRNYNAIDGLTIQHIQSSKNPSTDLTGLDLNKKSIGGSYEIFATQVDANRGYNYDNSLKENELYSGNKTAKMENRDVTCVKKFLGICFKRRWNIVRTNGSGCDLSEDGDQGGCEDPFEYAVRNWGGASPLNLSGGEGGNFVWNVDYSYTGAVNTVFDIAGSTQLTYPEYESNSFSGAVKYSNLTLRRFSPKTDKKKFKTGNPLKKSPAPYGFGYDYSMDYEVKFTNMLPVFGNNDHIARWQRTGVLTTEDVDYFTKYNATATKEGNVLKIEKKTSNNSCFGAGEIYTYKTLDSRVKNDSVNADEINGYTYNIFTDPRSHSRQFYDELASYVEAVSGSVNAVVGSDDGSLKNNLTYIKRKVDSINDGFQEIIDYNLDQVENLDTTGINNKAQEWLSVFDGPIAAELLQKIKDAQNGVLDLSGFVEVGDTLFDGVIDFIEEEKRLFKVNGWDLIFLTRWKTDLFSEIKDILENYEKLNLTIGEAGVIYAAINELGKEDVLGVPLPVSMNIVNKLGKMKEDLSDKEGGSGCETKYQPLCNALDTLIVAYNFYADRINEEKDGINNLKIERYNDDGDPTGEYDTVNKIFLKLGLSAIFSAISSVKGVFASAILSPLGPMPVIPGIGDDDPMAQLFKGLYTIPSTGNEELLGVSPGMNDTTSDRPIDSPRYLTFKGIGGSNVTFIYPDIYKAEIFSGNSENGVLNLKSPLEIKEAIKEYLRAVVMSYNRYLIIQSGNSAEYYGNKLAAFNQLDTYDPLANPNHKGDSVRPYQLFSGDYLIKRLEDSIKNSPFFSGDRLANEDPILFIANMIYYQNLTWQVKSLSGTIQGDFDNQRLDFDINEKVSYLMDNYLIKDNDRGKYLTPDYRNSGYEVAFINSNGNDRILYENTPDFVEAINTASSSYATSMPVASNTNATTLEQDLLKECDIPEDGGVLLFSLSNGRVETPWFNAFACWLRKTISLDTRKNAIKITFPFSWDTGASVLENIGDIFNVDEYKDMGKAYLEQWKLMDTDDLNNDVIENMSSSNQGNASTLQDILSYTVVKAKTTTVPADNANSEIIISSTKKLGNVDFHIVNVGASKAELGVNGKPISSSITAGTGGFSTGKITFDPYNETKLSIKFKNPIDGLNVVLIYMCLPGTQNMSNCVTNSVGINVVPGEVQNISIELEKDTVLEGASVPFKVKGTDKYGNEVGELISKTFETLSSSGNLTLKGVTAESIKFTNFDKTNFNFNATGGNLDGKTVSIQVSGSIEKDDGNKIYGTLASGDVKVIKGRLDTYSGSTKLASGNNIIDGYTINLPNRDIYYTNGQPNLDVLPKISFKLVDKNGNIIEIDGKISAKTKNNLVSLGNIVVKSGGDSADVYKFSKTNTFYLSSGIATIYLSPSFVAGEDLIYISMPGVDDIQLPIDINHASPKVVSLSAGTSLLDTESSTEASLKIFDNWNNIIDDEPILVNLGTANDRLTLSQAGTIIVSGGSYNFVINSHEKGGLGYVYATINTGRVPIDKQSPDTLSITIQEKMLPESGLNVMYLNLFGNDWGNQWGYMSDNEKYSESLIQNSEKLITVTTQLMNQENIKYFPIIIDNKLKIDNIIGNKINFVLKSGRAIFDIQSIGTISTRLNGFNLKKILYSGDELDLYIEHLMDTNGYKGQKTLFYIPETTDSIISGNDVEGSTVYINNKKVFDINNYTFDKNLTISLSEDMVAGYQVWKMYFGDAFVGKLLFAVDNEDGVECSLMSTSQDYGVSEIRVNGTSDEYGIGFYELESSLPNSSFGYKSIQDSYNPILGIGFTADFKNITNFGGGMPVGEATLPFSSELLINIGDPLLKRVSDNETAKIYDEESGEIKEDTYFDLGLGEVIYSEPGKEIHKVINIDFNNDKLEDIIVIFKDGTIKILKNYGGTNPFKNLGTLTILADRISDVSVGDVDGNGYKDLIIWLASGGLRVYKNNGGIFDVDGYPVCINVNVNKGEISENPENVSGIHQIFLEDMDLDGAMDIVTNDKLGFIKIFYGGTTHDGNVNYLSTNKYLCDDGRYDRVNENSQIVYQFGIKLDSNSHILDQSLVRRQGISDIETGDITAEDLGINGGLFQRGVTMDNMGDALSSLLNFDVDAAGNLYMQNERFKQVSFGVIPVYESGIDNEADLDYVEIGALTGSDPVKIYKTYEDLNDNPIDISSIDYAGPLTQGDTVRVSVYIIANKEFTGTFIDKIVGPWNILLSEYDGSMFEHFWFDHSYVDNGRITLGQIDDMTGNIHRDLDNSRYMIDNIHMRAGDMIKISYGLMYNEYRVFNIDVAPLSGNNYSGVVLPRENLARYSHDNYPDISTQPTDGCNDSMFVFFNNGLGARDYELKYMDLARLTAEYMDKSKENEQEQKDKISGGLGSSASTGDPKTFKEQISSLVAGGLSEALNWQGMLSVDVSSALNLGIIDGVTNDIVKKIDDVIGGSCNGLDLSSLGLGGKGGCGLPVPFNQAFLGVGKYHLFGCYNLDFLDNLIGAGWPAMTFPGNRGPVYGVYLPFPGIFGYPFKGPGDSFVDFVPQNGTYPSMFRLYLMPTLTLNLGIALCFGPYGVGKAIKDPIGSVAGNCIVFAVKPNCGNSDTNTQLANATTEIPYEYTLLKGCSKQNNPIYLGANESSTPFVFGGSSSDGNTFQPIIPEGSYAGGFINIEIEPESDVSYKESSAIDLDAIILEGGAKIQNQIQGSKEQGLIDKIVKQWLDKQIKYIMNNLTNFKISIIWPDLEGLIGKRNTVKVNNVQKDMSTADKKKEECEQGKGKWVESPGNSSYCEDTPASLQLKCENRGLKWNSSDQTCVASDSALSKLDARGQRNVISREKISSWSDYTNPFEKLAEVFSETPLLNISTQDITVNVPMLTSEDITSYVSMSQSRVNRQSEILSDWEEFFKGIVSYCSEGSININGIEDLGNAITQLKEQYKDASYYAGEDDDELGDIQGKINALENIEKTYNFKDLGNYNIYEAKSGGYYIRFDYLPLGEPLPYDVYIYVDPSNNLSMATSGFTLQTTNTDGKTKVSVTWNGEKPNSDGVKFNKAKQKISHSCASIFADGTIDGFLNGFLNVQSSAETLIFSVKENIETLQQYKLFPLELYEWIHVLERYLGDISSLVNSVLGTLSMWMETNANRYSQYVDAIITLMTVLETYQLIIDFSADWTESCSTCTNDNYDQFSCKLGAICDMLHIELPIFEIPPTKIPSIYLDFSEIHAEMDIKLPSFTFNPVAIPLPELPNLPEPPSIDFTLNLEDSLQFGIDIVQQLKGIDLSVLSSINMGDIPLIPSPPQLPDLPSFIPSLEMELPLLPPAPKIPELPNTIQGTIKAAKIVGKILCIIKGKFGLVAENSIKAKIEQITQRDYQLPFRDNLDLTSSEWNKTTAAKMPDALANVFTGVATLLQTSEFKEAQLKGFDLSLKTYIDLHFSFDDFYAFVESVVGKINDITYDITDFVSESTDFVSGISRERQDRLQACVNNPISVECLPGVPEVTEYLELLKNAEKYKSILDNSFSGIKELLKGKESKKSELEDVQAERKKLLEQLYELQRQLNTYLIQLENTDIETERKEIIGNIDSINQDIESLSVEINKKQEEINSLQTDINELDEEYGLTMDKYSQIKELYDSLVERLTKLKEELTAKWNKVVDEINEEIKKAEEIINFEDLKRQKANVSSGQTESDNKKERDKERRSENLQDLYKEVDDEATVSYVDYDSDINENNFKVLETALAEIKDQTNNKDIKNRAQEHLSLISMNRKIDANIDSINDVENKYSAVIDNYKASNDEIIDLIENDYDSFLVAVGNNDSSLVKDNSFNITLSTQLFDMDKNTVKALSNQEDIMKKYMDYNMNNLQGYLNALENNSPETLNMDEEVYNLNKSYLSKVKDEAEAAYSIITKGDISSNDGSSINDNNPILLAQTAGGNVGNNGRTSSSSSTVDIANYIDGYTINTKEGSFLLANTDYINKFQSRFLLTDINKDSYSDLILWDEHNIYIKYRKGLSNYDNGNYDDASTYYSYGITSYENLLTIADDGYVKIGGKFVKLIDANREVKNFKYAGQTFDTIKVSRSNSSSFGDDVDGYLVKMIHRVDQFNDKEPLTAQGNNEELFDKKYILVLPEGSEITGTSLEIEEQIGRTNILDNIEESIGTGRDKYIFDLFSYSKSDKTINLTITDIPRNRQYSEIYTLNFINNTYLISSSSSNQIVAGPQIIADDQGPNPEIILYRPSISTGVSEGVSLEGYVGTHYVLQVDWEDNVALDEIWIADELGNRLVEQTNISNKTGYIEYSGLYFTGKQKLSYYVGGIDINGNNYVVNTTLSIKVPSVEITNILKGASSLTYNPFGANLGGDTLTDNGSMVTILAELDQDIDSGYVQFLRSNTVDKNTMIDKREILTGSQNNISRFDVTPDNVEVYGGLFDIGTDIGLYSTSGTMVATINPENGKITILNSFNGTISTQLDYSPKRPIIKVLEGEKVIFWIIFSSLEFVDLEINSNELTVQDLDNEIYGKFYGGDAVLKGNDVLLYISPTGDIYTDATIYGDYDFDDATNSVIYTFKMDPYDTTPLGKVYVKVKNILE